MPTYQYSCTECAHFFETVQSFSDDSLSVCPQCEGRLRKVFNAVGVVFKGSGFYRNDSRGQQPGADASTAAGKESSGSAEKGSGDKGSGDKGSGEKSAGDKGSAPVRSERSKDGGAATSRSAADSIA